MKENKPKKQVRSNGHVSINQSKINYCNDIAIIGIACRFPGAQNYQDFWENLINGVDSIKEINRWDYDKHYSKDGSENKSISKWCGLLEDIDQFDNNFFNISPREARYMDPQQRILLEETWGCIEDSGVSLEMLQRNRTSVYVGAMTIDSYLGSPSEEDVDIYSGPGTYPFMLANKISYYLGLNGESKVIETGCSSALVGLCEAKNALAAGDSDYAIVAGVNVHFSPLKYLMWSKNRMLSIEGKCKTFDKDANGFVSGEGAGVLLLQPLDKAVEQQNHIYGVIKGCAVNHGGKSVSISAPRVEAQRDVILAAYENAGFEPDSVTYIEAHGTGTSLGDPIEIEALTLAFRKFTSHKQFCKIGSVKTNIGHLEAAAGIAGVIKVLLMIKNKKIPATLNMQTLNPIIDFQDSPFCIADNFSGWDGHKKPLRAGVSSFGFGGVNSHVLLEECKEKAKKAKESELDYPFVLSAKNPQSLTGLLETWKKFIDSTDFSKYNLKDICLTLLTGREAFAYRCGSQVKDKDTLTEFLKTAAVDTFQKQGEEPWGLCIGEYGWHSYEQLDPMIKEFPVFKETLDMVLDCLDQESEMKKGFLEGNWPKPFEAVYSFIIAYVCIATLLELGFSPGLVIGIKNGLWAGLTVSGVLSLEDTLAVLSGKKEIKEVQVSRPVIPFYDPIKKQALMPYVFDEEYLDSLISKVDIPDRLLQDSVNKAQLLLESQFTFKKYMEEWEQSLKPIGLNISMILHEREWLTEDGTKGRKKLLLMIMIMSSIDRLNQKWNLSERKPVEDPRFYELLDLVLDGVMPKETLVMLLVSTGPDLSQITQVINSRQDRINQRKPYSFLKEHHKTISEIPNAYQWFEHMLEQEELPRLSGRLCFHFGKHMMDGFKEEVISLNTDLELSNELKRTLTGLWLKGADIRWKEIYSESSFKKVPAPVYAFNRSSFWLPEKANSMKKRREKQSSPTLPEGVIHPLLHQNTSDFSEHRYSSSFTGKESFLTDYRVNGLGAFPGSLHIEMACAAVRQAVNRKEDPAGIRLQNIRWGEVLSMDGQETRIHIGLFPEEKGKVFFEIYCNYGAENSEPIVHSQGCAILDTLKETPVLDIEALQEECSQCVLLPDQCYDVVRAMGLEFGPGYRGLKKVYIGADKVLAELCLTTSLSITDSRFILHPVIMESALQAVAGLRMDNEHTIKLIPSALEELEVFTGCADAKWAKITYRNDNKVEDKEGNLDIDLCDDKGTVCVRMKGMKFQRLGKSIRQEESLIRRSMCLLRKQWEPSLATSGEGIDKTVAILTSRETMELAALVSQQFIKSRILEHCDLERQTEHDMKQYAGVVDLIGCRKEPSESIEWIPWLQQLIEHGSKEGLMLLCVTKGLESFKNTSLNLAGACRAGLYRMLQNEYSQIRSRHMDGEPAADDEELAKLIASEFFSNSRDSEVCYRSGNRYRAFLDELPESLDMEGTRAFPEDHVLWITGGTRGIGALCAQHFAVQYGVKRMVLTGREEMPPRDQWEIYKSFRSSAAQKIEAIEALEAQGVNVKVLSVSLEDKQALKKSLEEVKSTMGPIGGIIHCAGILDKENPAFIRKNMEGIERVLQPKVSGTQILYETFKNEPLQFMILFSSVSADITALAVGQSDYAMANAYMDYFAQAMSGVFPVYSIQWPNWKETGMGEIKSKAYQETGLFSHTNSEGLHFLDLILSRKLDQVVMPAVVNPDLWKPRQLVNYSKKPPAVKSVPTVAPNALNSIEHINIKIHEWLIELFSKELNINLSELDIKTPFQDFGMDSILLAQVVTHMDKQLGQVAIDPSLILEYPTIQSLACYLAKTYPKVMESKFSEGVEEEKQIIPSEEDRRVLTPLLQPKKRKAFWDAEDSYKREKIAVVGMACRFPDAEDIGEYWKNLREGRDCIREVPKSRWDWEKYYEPNGYKEGKSISKWGAFLKGIEEFDPEYFKIPESLASQIDPLQRQWLEVSVEALTDAGYEKKDLWGKTVGVFAGTRTGGFSNKLQGTHKDRIIGTGQNFVTAHLAHICNFKGPNIVVDTACSSSLTAIHLAVRSIQNGESEIALAGGVEILLDENVFIGLSAAKILSPQGRCKTFDARANGIGVGEGCGVVVLKPLRKAIEDKDKIYGVIDGSAVNNDGNTMGVTTPNPEAQVELIEAAIRDGGINPETISYVETHGTGTLIGDPIELKALTRVFKTVPSKKQFCGVGSVKSNIGHLLSAAGAASIIKVLLSMIHRELPPTLHCSTPNPRFNFDDSPFYLVQERKKWTHESQILRAGISSFGLGGNNAHIIVSNEGIPAANIATVEPRGERVIFKRKRYWPQDESKTTPTANREEDMAYRLEQPTAFNEYSSQEEEGFMEFFKSVRVEIGE